MGKYKFKDILRQHPKILMWNLSSVPSTNVPNFWKYLENLPWLRAYELEENDAVRLLWVFYLSLAHPFLNQGRWKRSYWVNVLGSHYLKSTRELMRGRKFWLCHPFRYLIERQAIGEGIFIDQGVGSFWGKELRRQDRSLPISTNCDPKKTCESLAWTTMTLVLPLISAYYFCIWVVYGYIDNLSKLLTFWMMNTNLNTDFTYWKALIILNYINEN